MYLSAAASTATPCGRAQVTESLGSVLGLLTLNMKDSLEATVIELRVRVGPPRGATPASMGYAASCCFGDRRIQPLAAVVLRLRLRARVHRWLLAPPTLPVAGERGFH